MIWINIYNFYLSVTVGSDALATLNGSHVTVSVAELALGASYTLTPEESGVWVCQRFLSVRFFKKPETTFRAHGVYYGKHVQIRLTNGVICPSPEEFGLHQRSL